MTVKELRELLARATKGPWSNLSIDDEPIESVWTDKEAIATWDIGKPSFTVYGEDARNDAALIVALRNSADAMLDVVEAAKAVLDDPEPLVRTRHWDALRAALAKLEGAG